MTELKEKLIALLKLLKIFPGSGFGEVNIKVENNKIVLVETKEKHKIDQ
jgi:hypothetical protein